MSYIVAPLVGAWIEMVALMVVSEAKFVAPLVGAWIEILAIAVDGEPLQSLLSWERGLKYLCCFQTGKEVKVAPLVGAWIEM